LNRVGGFKLKLVAWFTILAFAPLAVAWFGYDSLARKSERERADARLETALRASIAGYSARLEAATAVADAVAARPALQLAVRSGQPSAIAAAVHGTPFTQVVGPGFRVGKLPPNAGTRSAAILADGHQVARVIVGVPLSGALLSSLDAGLRPHDLLVVLRDGRLVAGGPRGTVLRLEPGHAAVVRVAGTRYRALATAPLPQPQRFSFAALTPQSNIDAAVHSAQLRLTLALAGALLLFGGLTYWFGRSILRTVRRLVGAADALAHGRLDERVEVSGRDEFAQLGRAFNAMASQLQLRLAELDSERDRSRAATARFGAALAATHDSMQLMRIVVESAMEATGAVGGLVLGHEGVVTRVGDPDGGPDRIAFPLRIGASDFGSLIISGAGFEAEQVETAASLVAQVVVSLENARLHRAVEREALADSLTGLANRRSLEATLKTQLARAQRFSEEVAFVLADLDDFKGVNDRYGHPVGDEVLRQFSEVLAQGAREMDVAGRWGGEEFALVLPATDAAGAVRVAERARLAMEDRRIAVDDGEIVVTASFGVASYPDTTDHLPGLIAAADAALYSAKRQGKNRVVRAVEPAWRRVH
jgi:diguanylate cyclase (GGDEF)-like protein